MFYTIYKTTNKINGKIYIGKHQTKDLDDGYMGSGKHLNYAIQKYGIENFTKEILHIFDNEDEMNDKEAEMVTEEFVKEDTNYNLCPGGKGGWGYNNTEEGQKLREFSYGRWQNSGTKSAVNRYYTDETYQKEVKHRLKKNALKGGQRTKELYPEGTFAGKTHSEETKRKMKVSAKGKHVGANNSQYDTMWITNGIESKKIKKGVTLPDGWYKGRRICG